LVVLTTEIVHMARSANPATIRAASAPARRTCAAGAPPSSPVTLP